MHLCRIKYSIYVESHTNKAPGLIPLGRYGAGQVEPKRFRRLFAGRGTEDDGDKAVNLLLRYGIRRALGVVSVVTICLGSLFAAAHPALSQVPPMTCDPPGSTEPIGPDISGSATLDPGDGPVEWRGPCGSRTVTQGGATGKNWSHYYVTLTETGYLGVRIAWPDPSDEFDVFVYRGHIDPDARVQDEEQELARDQTSGSWLEDPPKGGIKRFLLGEIEAGTYTIRTIYRAVVEGYYEGAIWALPPDSVIPPDDPGLPERGSYPLQPQDDYFTAQWGLHKIKAPEAWQTERATGFGINIAVVDSGTDLEHSDLLCAGKLVVHEGATIGKSDPPHDRDGHGTHVAGIAAACTDNGKGVAGVAPDATVIPVNATDAIEDSSLLPGGSDEAMAAGIRFATEAGAHVINLSIGPLPPESYFSELHPQTEAALREAHGSGVVIAAAAGNFSSPVCEYPSLSRFVICVGATDRNRRRITAILRTTSIPARMDCVLNRA